MTWEFTQAHEKNKLIPLVIFPPKFQRIYIIILYIFCNCSGFLWKLLYYWLHSTLVQGLKNEPAWLLCLVGRSAGVTVFMLCTHTWYGPLAPTRSAPLPRYGPFTLNSKENDDQICALNSSLPPHILKGRYASWGAGIFNITINIRGRGPQTPSKVLISQ